MTVNCTPSQKQPTAVFYAQFHPEKWAKEAQLKEQSANRKADRSHMGWCFICPRPRRRHLHRPKNKTRIGQIYCSSQRRQITEFDQVFFLLVYSEKCKISWHQSQGIPCFRCSTRQPEIKNQRTEQRSEPLIVVAIRTSAVRWESFHGVDNTEVIDESVTHPHWEIRWSSQTLNEKGFSVTVCPQMAQTMTKVSLQTDP